jgi:adenine-specific DNA-methyltransferase
MNMDELRKKRFTDTLTGPYDHQTFILFLKELLNDVQIVNPDRLIQPYNTFSVAISGYYHIGNFTGKNGSKIALFSVELKNNKNLENARSIQRNFVKNLLEESGFQGALVAFYTKEEPDKWRLSFVRLDYEFSQGKISKKLTPAKRYSFLVGKGEPCHTAQQQLFPIFGNENENPSIDDLESAFSVEAVTDDFFNQYKEKFLQLKDVLDNNESFNAEAESRGFTSEQFAKKLMGQIVFLYFVQKKGWLGVGAFPPVLTSTEYKNAFYSRGQKPKQLMPVVYSLGADGNYHRNGKAIINLSGEDQVALSKIVRGNPWGSGPKDFMRQLFDIAEQRNKNYFDDFLEPLFYTGLNQNRGENAYFVPLNCRIPFLNDGLFEQLDGYDWEHNDFSIPNEIFSNRETKGDREADGILDIFDRYNFTIAEDEPMEREVAIDPEMLGKVFENLLDVKDRKSKGAFYTPREIVHYMCQESLINYLSTNSHISEDAIRDFILYGDFYKDIDTEKTLRTTDENGKTHYEIDPAKPMKISEEIFSLSKGINNLKLLDDLLANIRVADPAVGSGAFPLGMLNEVVRARQNLSAYMAIGMNAYDTRLMYTLERSPYMLKYTTIKNCIFAADIEPSAVDIARLRLWLSLVIDDEINPNAQNSFEGHQNPSPLPNLECNIVCGNSLVDEFEGTPLINASSLIGTTGQLDFNSARFESILPKLFDVQDRLYRCDDPVKKDDIKEELADVKDMLIRAQISLMSDSARQRYEQSKRLASKPYVLWQIDFAKVFNEKGGFDVVIGNPPYVDSEEMTRSMPELRELYTQRFSCAKGNWDLFVLFIEKGITLLKPEGVISFIVPNKLVSAPYTVTLRKQISQYQVQEIRDYSNVNVFKSAAVYPVVFRIKKIENKTKVNMDVMEDMYAIRQHSLVEPKSFYADIDWDKYFGSSQSELSIVEKMKKYKPLSAYATVNGAATVNEAYLVKEFLADGGQDITGKRKFINTGGLDPYTSFWGRQEMRYLKGKYYYPVASDQDVKSMSVKRYKESRAEKVIIGGMTKRLECYYDSGEYLAGKSTTIVLDYDHLKYVTAVLNSTLMTFYYRVFFNSMSLAGGFYRIGAPQVKTLPMAIPSDDVITRVEAYVDELENLCAKDVADSDQKNELLELIDNEIYSVYGLSEAEIDCVKNY